MKCPTPYHATVTNSPIAIISTSSSEKPLLR